MKILMVGAGNMGGAMLNAWQHNFPQYDYKIINTTNRLDSLPTGYQPDIVIFAVKPQIIASIINDYKQFNSAIFISILAGKRLEFFKNALGDDIKIIRTMPNLPSKIGQGVIGVVADNISSADKLLIDGFLSANGDVHWLGDESQMDDFSAIAGSGSAYLFYFIEAFMQAASNTNINNDIIADIVTKTISGASNMAIMSDEPASILRKNVTSPNGMTEAGLKELMADGKLSQLLKDTIMAAKKRCIELSE